MTRIAIIDMGTNTFHLLLAVLEAGGDYKIIYRTHEAVKVGLSGINEGVINEPAYQRAMGAVKKFKRIIDENNISAVYAFATSALRNARNGTALASDIDKVTGIKVRIISGDEEADLIYAGINAALDLGSQNSLVMDIGAGSVEFIIGDKNKVFWKQSVEIGGQRLLEKFHEHDPITAHEVAALEGYFVKTLGTLKSELEELRPKILVGSSGTFDTLSEIYCRKEGIALDPGASEIPLSIQGFYEIHDELIKKNRAQRMLIPGMIELRVDMIVVASCLIRYVMQLNRFEGIRVSTYSLKEGALALLAKGVSI